MSTNQQPARRRLQAVAGPGAAGAQPEPVVEPLPGEPTGAEYEAGGLQAGDRVAVRQELPPDLVTAGAEPVGGLVVLPGDQDTAARDEAGRLVPVDVDPAVQVSVSDLPGPDRAPILPPWLASPTAVRNTLRRVGGNAVYATAFHGLRLPFWYAPRVAWYAPIGAVVLVRHVVRWVSDAEADPLRAELVRRADKDSISGYFKLADQRDSRVRNRGVFVGLLALAAAVVVAVAAWWLPSLLRMLTRQPALGWFPGWVLPAAATVVPLVLLARAGVPRDKRLITPAARRNELPKLTSALIDKAFGSLRDALITAAIKEGGGLSYAAPGITRDERASCFVVHIELPHGVIPADIIDKRLQLASGLRRPAGCVWPEPAPDVHEGRLVLRILDKSLSQQPVKEWPLLKAGRYDYFTPYPFGWNVKGELISCPLFEGNTLVGAQPGMGKSAALRVAACAAALDPIVELQIFELLGKGDFRELGEALATKYVNGLTSADIEAAAAALAALRKEVERRADILGSEIPRSMIPDNKLTREVALVKRWGMHPILAILDECQNLFAHSKFGQQAGDDAEFIVRSARAVGVTLIIGTQRPDAKSLPTGISSSVAIRYCLRVLDHGANDMVLGSGMYKAGYKATAFALSDKGIGLLNGATDDTEVVRSAYIDGPRMAQVVARATKLREAAGTLPKRDQDGEIRITVSVVADVDSVFAPDETGLWYRVILSRLQTYRPDVYADWTEDGLRDALQEKGITVGRQLDRLDPETGERRNLRGIYAADVRKALDAPQPGR
jgi:S-DNA-T family DNA segregation ATPase FtsK/SpoIIIE